MRIEEAGVETVRALWGHLEPRIATCTTLEEAAQTWATLFFEEFAESLVLFRIFVTAPFAALPAPARAFVTRLAETRGATVGPATPVLSLIGTRGTEPAWNDRRTSAGHVGIPLVSARFIDDVPMIARLLQQLGLPLEWVISGDSDVVQRTLGSATGLFLVDDARQAVDNQGRKIITAQDFVARHGVRTVFGAGGAYFGGNILVFVAFCRHPVPRARALRFTGLVNFFKSRTGSLAAPARIFSDRDAA